MKNLIRRCCLLILLPVFAAQAESARVALVIGNAAYESSALKNPVNDAELISDALKQAGFRVTTVKNANRGQMEEAIKQFGRELQPDSTALFYYAGHGVQHEGKNYLLPIGAIGSIQKPGQIDDRAISAAYVLGAMEDSRIKLVFLDACRDAPFAFSRSLSRGLAPMGKSGGTLISYATMPGTTAADGDSRNSPYARSLAKWMREPLKIEDILKQVGSDVEKETGGKQSPEYTTAVRTDFYFIAPTTPPTGENVAAAPVVAQDADAVLREAGKAFDEKDYGRARHLWQPLAEAGNATAQISLGVLYSNGHGVKRDYAKARAWYEKAAAQDDKAAQFYLGLLYYGGKGVKQDYAKARAWWEKSAELGDINAQFWLGLLYEEGKGGARDLAKARQWYEKAAAQGNKDAEEALQRLQNSGKQSPEYTTAVDADAVLREAGKAFDEKDYGRARHLWQPLAEAGNATAQISLGVLYSNGHGVKRDYAKARAWYEKAAAQDDKAAQFYLGLLYYGGKGVKQDYAKARAWWEKSAELGDINAQFWLGLLYEEGKGGARDLAKARQWYEKAAAQGNKDALQRLQNK